MKRILSLLIAGILCIPLLAVTADAATPASFSGTFRQGYARTVAEMVNTFRTGSEAWFWNKDNTTKTVYNTADGTALKTLTYDYALEQIAMQRAVELARLFSHSRPNGTGCFSCTYDGYQSWGENIAAGHRTPAEVVDAWKETNDRYSGQGHRRNMLMKDYTAIGVACFECDGMLYWVQEFSYLTSTTPATDPCEDKVDCTVDSDGNVTYETFKARTGDVNADGKVDATDRMILARYLAGWEGYEDKILSMDAADIDGDDDITASDRMILARYLAGWEGYAKYFETETVNR